MNLQRLLVTLLAVANIACAIYLVRHTWIQPPQPTPTSVYFEWHHQVSPWI